MMAWPCSRRRAICRAACCAGRSSTRTTSRRTPVSCSRRRTCALMPDWLKAVSAVNPLTYMVEALRSLKSAQELSERRGDVGRELMFLEQWGQFTCSVVVIAAVGLTDIEVRPTHAVADGLHGALVRANDCSADTMQLFFPGQSPKSRAAANLILIQSALGQLHNGDRVRDGP